MPRSRLGLRSRLLLLGLIAALPALVLAFEVGRQLQISAAEAARERALHNLQQVGQTYERAIATSRSLLTLLAAMPELRQDGESCRRALARLQNELPRYANLGVIGPDGMLRCSVLPFSGRLDLSDRHYFQEAVETGEFAIGRYQIGRVTDRPTLNMAHPIHRTGQPPAVVFAALDLAWLRAQLVDSGLPAGSRVALLDAGGTTLVSITGSELAAGEQSPDAEAVREAVGEDSAGIARVLNGSDAIYVFTSIGGSEADLLLYAAIPRELAFAEADRLLMTTVLGGVAVLVLVLAGAWIFGQLFIIRRINELQALSGRISRGELGARSQLPDDGSELGQLGRAFNEMASSLEQREAAMRQQQAHIDRLNRVYAVLSGINGVIIRAADQDQLLDQACRIAAEQGHFPLAWVALLDADGRLDKVWQAGDRTDSAGELLPKQGAVGAALKPLAPVFEQGREVIFSDLQASPDWSHAARSAARRRGYGAALALPLRSAGAVVGCLCLYAQESGFFNQEEVRLLKELAADVSLALGHIRQAERLAFLAQRDALTGLPNTRLFQERLNQALQLLGRTGAQLAVMAIAVEGLEVIANVHGQHVADQLLREAAERINERLGGGEQLGRLSHASFGAFLAGIEHPEAAAELVDQLMAAFQEPLRIGGGQLYLSVRVGIALAPEDGKDAQVLLQHAGSALSSVRLQRDNYRFFTPQIHCQAHQRLSLEHALRRALEREEFHLVYQPLVELRSGQVLGVEVLLRWHNPALGDPSPAQFIPVAEASGIISQIGDWVLEQACLQAKAWAEAGLGRLKVAVNVSVSQLRQPDFLPRLEAILAATGADPQTLALGLEVTESELMEEAGQALPLLSALRERGFALAIDDFGTGYSSLAYLRQLPVDTLKIDVSFVRDLTHDSASASIIDAIIALARHLGLSTVAEGVESSQQLELLGQLGCDSVQGNVFSEPVPAAQVPALLQGRLAPQPAKPIRPHL